MVNIILCGGSGTRLWPVSRKNYPKQFCDLLDGESLFQRTILRNNKCDKIYIATNLDSYFTAQSQLDAVSDQLNTVSCNYLLEPVGKNTAPAVALACFDLDPEEIVLVTPADHIILKNKEYWDRVYQAKKLAEKDSLIVFGIFPTCPKTGYGYIESEKDNSENIVGYKVNSFKEKPDLKLAEKYLKAGNYFWNSGMTVFKAGIYLNELKKYSPQIYEKSLNAYQKAEQIKNDNGKTIQIDKEAMQQIPSDSIDYAVLEKSNNVQVIPLDIGWNDLGSFDSLYEVLAKDEYGNTLNKKILNIDSKNNLIISSKRKIVVVGVEDSIIIDTPDALLVGKKGQSQLVKSAVEKLQAGNYHEKELTMYHATVYRPWGSYTVLEDNKNYRIKNIVVKPGKRLSLQKHLHRSEHWVVVSGTAKVTVGEEELLIKKNESTYIPIGVEHRLANTGKIDLIIIESQVGDYMGEDDIIRIEDDYKRF